MQHHGTFWQRSKHENVGQVARAEFKSQASQTLDLDTNYLDATYGLRLASWGLFHVTIVRLVSTAIPHYDCTIVRLFHVDLVPLLDRSCDSTDM